FFFQAEDGIRDLIVTGVQTCALPISRCRRLNLRKGVQFHTGRELTADDIVWNLKRATGDNKLNGGVWVATFRPMTSVEATDKYRSEERRVGKECRCGWAEGG